MSADDDSKHHPDNHINSQKTPTENALRASKEGGDTGTKVSAANSSSDHQHRTDVHGDPSQHLQANASNKLSVASIIPLKHMASRNETLDSGSAKFDAASNLASTRLMSQVLREDHPEESYQAAGKKTIEENAVAEEENRQNLHPQQQQQVHNMSQSEYVGKLATATAESLKRSYDQTIDAASDGSNHVFNDHVPAEKRPKFMDAAANEISATILPPLATAPPVENPAGDNNGVSPTTTHLAVGSVSKKANHDQWAVMYEQLKA